jgi:cytochrome c553
MKLRSEVLMFISIPLFFFGSCTSADKEQLLPSVCIADSTITYSTDIVQIFEINCYGCHGQNSNETSGGINLQDTTELNNYIQNGKLLGNIMHSPGFDAMPLPPAPKLSDCQISQIANWIDRGAPKN